MITDYDYPISGKGYSEVDANIIHNKKIMVLSQINVYLKENKHLLLIICNDYMSSMKKEPYA